MRGASPAALVIGLALGPTACYRANDFASCSIACASDQSCPVPLSCDPVSHTCGPTGGCSLGSGHPDAPDDGSDGRLVPDVAPTGCLAGPMLPGDFCPTGAPGEFDLNGTGYSSDDCVANDPNGLAWSVVTLDLATGATACVVAADTIVVTGTVRVSGSRPLIIAAHTQITCAIGAIDVSSFSGSQGAGHGPFAACHSPTAALGQGGAGGSSNDYVGGAGGGNGNNTTNMVTTTLAPTSQLRGGCPGGDGGSEDKTGDTALRGEGGGAVYFRAPNLDIECQIDADAEPGSGGPIGTLQGGGGAGGGAGGTVAFDATNTFTLTTTPSVNGGGGGGGGTTEAGNAGTKYTAGDGASPVGGRGGDGSFTGNGNAGSPGGFMTMSGGGGGGGGASGVVLKLGIASTPP